MFTPLSWTFEQIAGNIFVGCHGHNHMVVLQLRVHIHVPMQSASITTNVVSLNATHGEVYSIQHCVIKFVSDLWQVSGFLLVLRLPSPLKLTSMINVVESGIKHHSPTQPKTLKFKFVQ